MNTLLDVEEIMRRDFASRAAVVNPDGPTVNYAQLADTIGRLRETIDGAADERPIALALPNGTAVLACFLAVTGSGRATAPLNPLLPDTELASTMQDLNVQSVIVPPGDSAARRAADKCGIASWTAETDARDGITIEAPRGAGRKLASDANSIAMIVHTSGTTSKPKTVPLTHGNIISSMHHIGETYALTPDDVSLAVMPFFHVHGLIGVALSTLSRGGSLVVQPKFSASRFWSDVRAHHVTWYSAVPTIHQILLSRADADQAPRDVLRFIRSCSSALPGPVFDALQARFETPVLQAYGMTEAAHQMASNPLPPAARRNGSVGRGTGVEIVILDEKGNLMPVGTAGEVSIRGSNVMHGYLENPTANATAFSGGYFRTGDEGVLDANGYLTLVGRLKELINRGGEKISPLEVDDVLLSCPEVGQAVSFGIPDAKYGEEIVAAVVLRSNVDANGIEARILAECRDRLADFQVPKRLFIVEQLPKTATGKIRRLDMPRLLGLISV